ncbi:MAG: right-handed parallel beta-helix repeat-containing protein [Woeseiaceae bacterium]|nr:right-handed parallel beta-helix repeat-containing protein [Woeseiaceae bacterium]
MQKDLTTWLPILLLVVLGTLAGIGKMLQSVGDSDGGVPEEISVTSRADRGPGSLRAALFAAMKAPHPVTIRLSVDSIDIDVPLPPIAADGTRIVGDAEGPVLLRRAPGNVSAEALLRVDADDVSVHHVAIDAAGKPAIFVQGARARLDTIDVMNSSIAIESLDSDELTVVDSEFSDNDFGVRLGGSRATATIRGNVFRGSRQSGIWVALATADPDADSDIHIHDNRFVGGRDGIVAVNVLADVRGNRVSGFAHAGINLLDARATVVGNQVLDSKGIGIHVSRLRDSAINANEVARNEQVGILIVDAYGLQVDGNQVYRNGYGIAAVGLQPIDASVQRNTLSSQSIDGLIAIGESPFIDGNHSIENAQAGIRIMNLVRPGQPTIAAEPRLANNTLSGNGSDDVQYGDYVVQSP